MNVVQEQLIEKAIAGITLTLTRAEELPTLAERAAVFENRLIKTRHVLEALQSIEQARREREQASAGAAA